jgi:hypothetical protein
VLGETPGVGVPVMPEALRAEPVTVPGGVVEVPGVTVALGRGVVPGVG